MDSIILKSERLILRPLTPDDLDSVHEYASDSDNTTYMLHLPNDTIEKTKLFVSRVVEEWRKDTPSFYEFAVINDGKLIGAVSVSLDESRREAELGWIINKKYWGNGYATEAAKTTLDFAIANLKVGKIVAHCDFRNRQSYSVMQKIGLSFERDDGVRRYKGCGEDIQELMYSLTIDS